MNARPFVISATLRRVRVRRLEAGAPTPALPRGQSTKFFTPYLKKGEGAFDLYPGGRVRDQEKAPPYWDLDHRGTGGVDRQPARGVTDPCDTLNYAVCPDALSFGIGGPTVPALDIPQPVAHQVLSQRIHRAYEYPRGFWRARFVARKAPGEGTPEACLGQ